MVLISQRKVARCRICLLLRAEIGRLMMTICSRYHITVERVVQTVDENSEVFDWCPTCFWGISGFVMYSFKMLHSEVRETLRVRRVSGSPLVVDILHVKIVVEFFEKLSRHGAMSVV